MKIKFHLTYLSFIICVQIAKAQDCPKYYETLKLIKEEINTKNYEQALADIRIAQIAAKDCDRKSTEADDLAKILLRKQAEDFKELSDRQMRGLANYIAAMNAMVNQSQSNNPAEFASFKVKMLKTLIAAQKYIDANITNINSTNDLSSLNTNFHLAESYEQSGDIQSAFDKYELSFNILKKVLAQKDYPKSITTNSFYSICVDLCTRYSNLLVNKGSFNIAYSVLNECEVHVPSAPVIAEDYYALARVRLASAYIEACLHSSLRATELYKNAFTSINKALALQPKNPTFINGLVEIRNAICLERQAGNVNLDSLYQVTSIPERTIGKLCSLSFTDINSAINFLQFKNNQSAELLAEKKWKTAKDTVEKILQMVNEHLKHNPNQQILLLIRANTHLNLATISRQQRLVQEERYQIGSAIKDWMASIQNQQLPSAMLLLTTTANQIEQYIPSVFTKAEILDANYQINRVITGAGQDLLKYPQICQLLGRLYATDGQILEERGDTLANSRFKAAIINYETSNIAKNLSVYSFELAYYAHAYTVKLQHEVQVKDMESATLTFSKLTQELMPYYQHYNFDINLAWELTNASKAYGSFLYSVGQYRAALSPLEFASFHGMKSCSETLAKIYKILNQDANAKLYTERADMQHDDAPRIFQIPLEDSVFPEKITVYVLDRPYNYPYKGIEDAAKWTRVAYHSSINSHYIEEFNRSQYLAWGNSTSFKMMSDKAWDKAQNEIFILNKYAGLKKEIEAQNISDKKITLSNALYKQYENDINIDTINRGAIITDAINFYLSYARLLQNAGLIARAREVYEHILKIKPKNYDALFSLMEIDYDDHTANFIKKHLNDGLEQLITDLDFYLSRELYDQAANIRKKILHLRSDPQTKDTINVIYTLHGMGDQFEYLFLHERQINKDYITYFAKKNIDSTSNEYKRDYYLNVSGLYQKYLENNSQDTSVRKIASESCSKLVWYCILTKKDYNLNYWNAMSLEYDPGNKQAKANVFNIFLYYNETNNANEQYRMLKNQEFDKAGQYPTYRDFFLNNVADLRKNGVTNETILTLYKTLINDGG